MMDGINAGGQTSAPKAAWYETIKPAVASTLTLAVTGAIYGAVSGAVQDATSALLKASPPSKSGADLNAGALPLAALVVSGLAGGVCGWNAGKMAYDRINEKDWLGDWGRRARDARPGRGRGGRRYGGGRIHGDRDCLAVRRGEARPTIRKTMRRGTALPAWSGR